MAESIRTITPDDDTHNDCPVLTKTRMVSVNKGVAACISWEVRDRAGSPLDLCECLPTCCAGSSSSSESSDPDLSADSERIAFRFTEALGQGTEVCDVTGTCVDAANGLVSACLPAAVYNNPGIYQQEVGIFDEAGILSVTDKGWISVERGLFGAAVSTIGPVTLNEVRIQLRDTMFENDLLDAVEFDDTEIIHSIMRPIREWNEKPPPVAVFSTQTFPYHDHWLKAIIANLMKIAAVWYERNRLPASHGGITVDDRSKMNPYFSVAKMLEEEWHDFIITKKVQINAGLAMGQVQSTYGIGYW